MSQKQFKKIGIIGAGAIGANLALLFGEHGICVSLHDKDVTAVQKTIDFASKNLRRKIQGPFKDLKSFAASLDDENSPLEGKLILLSLPHGTTVDTVLEELRPSLKKGDVILDTGNEWYLNTENRQKKLAMDGITLCALGISGGYQGARIGPSMSLSGDDKEVKKKVLMLLERVAAKDKDGNPCVKDLGPGGSGHYIKMCHNGIEQGMLGVINEAWEIMFKCLSMSLEEIGDTFARWVGEGGEDENEGGRRVLANNYLLKIGSEICKTRKPKSVAESQLTDDPNLEDDGLGPFLLNTIQDKVVQDADNTEGTGIWTVSESAHLHISAPTISCAHFYRVASADRAERLAFFNLIGGEVAAAKKQHNSIESKRFFVQRTLRRGVHAGFLASFAQGINLISKASTVHNWNLSIPDIIAVWRDGSIIKDDSIFDLILEVYHSEQVNRKNLLLNFEYASDVKIHLQKLREVVLRGTEWDAHVPALSASLEYFKYCGGKHLPSQFMEAQLDYFGKHNFDLKKEGAGEVKKGSHHFEWKPA